MSEKTVRETVGKNYLIPCRQIVANHNPRNPLSAELVKDGYSVFEPNKEKQLPSLWSLATSDQPGDRAFYAHLIEERDPELAALAATILSVGQLEAVEVRDNGAKGGKGNSYTLVFGCRRVLAILYNWCVLGKPKEPVVEAKLSPKINEAGLLHRSVIENIRKEPTCVEIAKSLQMALNNQETIEDVAKGYGRSTTWVRNKLALLQLPADVLRRLADGSLKESRALQLLRGDGESEGENATDRGEREVAQAPQRRERPKLHAIRHRLEQYQKNPEQAAGISAIEILQWILGEEKQI